MGGVAGAGIRSLRGASPTLRDDSTSEGVQYPWVREVHVVYMTHLDVGFTDFASNVCALYFDKHFPAAIATARALKERGGKERFIYTSHPWLIQEYLDATAGCTGNVTRSPEALAFLEDAIREGDVTWHANAFSMFVPMLPLDLYSFSLDIGAALDKRFNQPRKIAASQKDTMGYARAAIPALRKAGVEALHMGANGACRAPDAPPVFIWRDGNGSDLLTFLFNRPSGATPCTSTFCYYGVTARTHALKPDRTRSHSFCCSLVSLSDFRATWCCRQCRWRSFTILCWTTARHRLPNASSICMRASLKPIRKLKSRQPALTLSCVRFSPMSTRSPSLQTSWVSHGSTECRPTHIASLPFARSRAISRRPSPRLPGWTHTVSVC
jgi:hypothetical protein